jgi:hypothetical protein
MLVKISQIVERVIFIDTEKADTRHQRFDTQELEQEAIDAVEGYLQAVKENEEDSIEYITDCDEIMKILEYAEDDEDTKVEIIK